MQVLEEFIRALFKNLDGYINVREIDLKSNGKNKFFKNVEELINYKPPADKNVYFGVYSRKAKSGKGEGCNTTGVLWADFDRMALSEVKYRIDHAGLPTPSIFVNSGSGIHTYWLLDKRAGNEAISILKAIATVTGADTRVAEKARIMRLPNSYNIKGHAVLCQVLEYHLKAYDIKLFKELLDVKEEIATTLEAKFAPQELLNSDRSCIRNAASGVKEGHRNFMLGRLTKYLQVKGYTKVQTKKIIIKWNEKNVPSEDIAKIIRDLESYWKEDYKLLGCSLNNPELQSILYDYCDRSKCNLNNTIGILKLDNSVKYNNRIFKHIAELTGNFFIVLGVLNRHKEGLTITGLLEKLTARVTKKSCMTEKTARKCLQMAIVTNMVEKFDGNRRLGKEHLYKIIAQGTYGTGYTVITNGAVNGAIDGRVTSGEFRLYVLLLKYAFSKGSCYPSLNTLAKELRVTFNEISNLLKTLERADYIKKNYGYLTNEEKLIITLLV
jgi:hypothetical protein